MRDTANDGILIGSEISFTGINNSPLHSFLIVLLLFLCTSAMATTVGKEVFLSMQGLELAGGAEALGLRGLGHPRPSQAVHSVRLLLLGWRGGDRVAESGQKSDRDLTEQKSRCHLEGWYGGGGRKSRGRGHVCTCS